MRPSLADLKRILDRCDTTWEEDCADAKAWLREFEADLKALLEIAEDGFNANPHDEYFSWHHGRMDLLQKILGVGEPPKEPLYIHLDYLGSELACRICNPDCYQNHGMGKIDWCGHEKCPSKPPKEEP